MKVTIFGSGYVGLVTGACLAEVGNHVVCVDVDPAKIDLLNSGGIPIFEPGLEDLVRRNQEAGRLRFTTDARLGIEHGLFQFICVGTPPDEDGSAAGCSHSRYLRSRSSPDPSRRRRKRYSGAM